MFKITRKRKSNSQPKKEAFPITLLFQDGLYWATPAHDPLDTVGYFSTKEKTTILELVNKGLMVPVATAVTLSGWRMAPRPGTVDRYRLTGPGVLAYEATLA
jgi:hypothetical protein